MADVTASQDGIAFASSQSANRPKTAKQDAINAIVWAAAGAVVVFPNQKANADLAKPAKTSKIRIVRSSSAFLGFAEARSAADAIESPITK